MISRANFQMLELLFYAAAFLSFGSSLILPFADKLLHHVEFPAFFDTMTIIGGDSKRFAVLGNIARVQRYDSQGRFEYGWFISGINGTATIGFTEAGNLAVARLGTIRVFNSNGVPIRTVSTKGHISYDIPLRPNPLVSEIGFRIAIQVSNPAPTWFTRLMFPFWHPFMFLPLLIMANLFHELGNETKDKNSKT